MCWYLFAVLHSSVISVFLVSRYFCSMIVIVLWFNTSVLILLTNRSKAEFKRFLEEVLLALWSILFRFVLVFFLPQDRRQIKWFFLCVTTIVAPWREQRCLYSYRQRQIGQSDRDVTANKSKICIWRRQAVNFTSCLHQSSLEKQYSSQFTWSAVFECVESSRTYPLFVAQVEMLNFLSKIWKYSVWWLQYEWRMSKIIVRCVYAVLFSNSVSFTRDRLSVFLIKCIISVTHLCSVSKYRQVTNWSYHGSNPARRWNSKKPFSLHRSFLFFSLKLVFLNIFFNRE